MAECSFQFQGMPPWSHSLLTAVLMWLVINTLLLNRWVLEQQCQSARALAAQLLYLHLGQAPTKQRRPSCHALLTANDPSYRHMLKTVLGAKTFAEQAKYTQRIDRLLRLHPQVQAEGTAEHSSVYYTASRHLIMRDAPELVESLRFRFWRGMVVDSAKDMDLVLLLLSHRAHMLALRRDDSHEALSPTASHGL